ncbi:hypothetical protein DACRYDRAFT_114545 [Dacryopinax primogenitus]|uniref:histidine kinase n=1 Tax=Dacryopinax primogenitus (strain DJM 731) TaxID=1858805 RepID=M5G5Z5_DACPD|nr:uncharacterized protein DACRYDRAFT_114545 [Dacryopinax primogenitus]EJU04144.1 hypothetical protein DACRYDRAFT_114545 [Dacryopinax primogenitus]
MPVGAESTGEHGRDRDRREDGEEGEGLPPPAIASDERTSKKSKSKIRGKTASRKVSGPLGRALTGQRASTSAGGGNKKVTKFEHSEGEKKPFRVRLHEFLKVISTAVSLSDSPIEPTVESTEASSYRANIQRRESDWGIEEDPSAPPAEVNEVVVDAEWDMDKWADMSTTGMSESAGAPAGLENGSAAPGQAHAARALGNPPDARSQAGFTNANSSGIRELWGLTTILRWRLYPRIVRFFDLSFYDAQSEDKYRKDVWFTQKTLAAITACFYLLITILNCTLVGQPFTEFNHIGDIGGGLVFSIPVLFLVLFNVPRMKLRYSWPYQVILMIATWQWAWYNVFDQWNCGFFISRSNNACGQKDFQLTPFYSAALPFLALFALGQNRLFGAIAFIAWEIVSSVLIIPVYNSWTRNTVNSTIWHILLLYVHFTLETAERRSFTLREQLKDQCKATQKAQVNERKESDSKKRFVSYIFHEVRVPLNTALLASQNLIGSGAIKKEEDVEFQALEGSLKMMSKVLNDVLDFNRMDSGRFVTVSKPYCFHGAIRSMLLPLELSAKSRGLTLTMRLDPKIDDIANRTAYGDTEQDVQAVKDGWVLGDEMRLRQLVTNLTSNACKFTSEGGRVHVETRLIMPLSREEVAPLPVLLEVDPETSDTEAVPSSSPAEERQQHPLQLMESITEGANGLNRATQSIHNHHHYHLLGHAGGPALYTPASGRSSIHSGTHGQPHKTGIVVRIEVRDTGVGIKPRDLVDNRLFSPYVQTEIGRFQGGKGTGLGLALVRNIVKLSGGRLGVKSKVGQGSTFWVELALGVGPHAVKARDAVPVRWDRSPAAVPPITSIDFANSPVAPLDTPLMSSLTPPLPNEPSMPLKPLGADVHAFLDPLTEKVVVPPKVQGPEMETPTAVNGTDAHEPPATVTVQQVTEPPQDAQERPLPILVVDDDVLTRRLMSRMLTRIGCTVELAENGLVALDYLIGPGAHTQAVTPRRLPSSTTPSALVTPSSDHTTEPIMIDEHKYAVVFLDNQMPLYSGVQVVEHLRLLGRTTFVVGVTGNALQEDQKEYLEAGVDKILTKPVLEKDLRNVVAIARERHRQLKGGVDPDRGPTGPSNPPPS